MDRRHGEYFSKQWVIKNQETLHVEMDMQYPEHFMYSWSGGIRNTSVSMDRRCQERSTYAAMEWRYRTLSAMIMKYNNDSFEKVKVARRFFLVKDKRYQ